MGQEPGRGEGEVHEHGRGQPDRSLGGKVAWKRAGVWEGAGAWKPGGSMILYLEGQDHGKGQLDRGMGLEHGRVQGPGRENDSVLRGTEKDNSTGAWGLEHGRV